MAAWTRDLDRPMTSAYALMAPVALAPVLWLHDGASPQEIEAARAQAARHAELFIRATLRPGPDREGTGVVGDSTEKAGGQTRQLGARKAQRQGGAGGDRGPGVAFQARRKRAGIDDRVAPLVQRDRLGEQFGAGAVPLAVDGVDQ
jgi:hypothetical protein